MQMRSAGNATASWMAVSLTQAVFSSGEGEVLVNELATYSSWVFRVRARTVEGFTAWSQSSASMTTKTICGDGFRQGAEECDTAGETSGCAACVVVNTFACSGGESGGTDSCSSGCGVGGDSVQGTNEDCDDGNNDDGDGCSHSCRLEPGWTCTAVSGQITTSCVTDCGDGIKAGSEACDSGTTINAGGHGCNPDCSMAAGAFCVESADLTSICQICGNGKVEGTEVCDDAAASGACMAFCNATKVGWSCSGGTFTSPDTCRPGPSTPKAPTAPAVAETQMTWKWKPPNSHFAPIVNYTLQWYVADGSIGHTNETTVPGNKRTAIATGLQKATAYKARVMACTDVGCSEWSNASLPILTSDTDAFAEFGQLSDKLTQNPT
eukprot:900624-Rhodomonas_salina.1